MITSKKSLMVVLVILFLFLLAAVCVPNFIRARSTPAKNACYNNLRQIEGAKEQWAMENKKTTNDIPSDGDLFGTDRYINSKPGCPASGTYSLGKVGERPTCSIGGPQHSFPK
jgi:hypothetical protein